MKEHQWLAERNEELLEQLEEFRRHAAESEPAWAVSLQILIDEVRKTLEVQVGKLQGCEEKAEGLAKALEEQKTRLEEEAAAQRRHLEEKNAGLSARVAEMEKLRDEEAYNIKKTLSFKEAEIGRLMHMLKLDPEGKRQRLIERVLIALVLSCVLVGSSVELMRRNVFWRRAEFPLPYAHPSAVGFVGGELAVGDWLTQSLYFHSPEKGLPILRVLPSPKVHLSGLASGGGRVLAADNWEAKLLTVNVAGGELELIREDPSPGPKPGGVFLDKDVLWLADPEAGKLFRRDLEGGQPPQDYAVPLKPRSVVRRDGLLWVLDERTGKVFRNKPGVDLDKAEAWTAVTPGFGEDGPKPVGMTADAESLWVLTIRPPRLVRYNLKYLKK